MSMLSTANFRLKIGANAVNIFMSVIEVAA
jgi:hypothetical protein